MNSQPAAAARPRATVVLPQPQTPMTTMDPIGWASQERVAPAGLALQDRAVEFVKPMPVFDRYSSVAGKDALVKKIEIHDNKEQG